MESTVLRDPRVMWALWLACGLAAVGAVAPLVTSAGSHSRITGVVVPFGVAAVAFGVNALIYHQGRPLATILYFIAGMAIVYGILAMVAIPIRLAVVGTCPPAPLSCPAGFEQPLTDGESNGFGIATFCGGLAIFIGFYALLVLYRRRTRAAKEQLAGWPAQPPNKPAVVAESEPAVAADKEHPPAIPAESPSESHTATGMEAHEEPKELPAPIEPKELPPPA